MHRVTQLANHIGPSRTAASDHPMGASYEIGIKAPEATKKSEKELRVELAAAYRIVSHYGWDDGIQNHLTVRIPDTVDQVRSPCPRVLLVPLGRAYSRSALVRAPRSPAADLPGPFPTSVDGA